MLQEIRQKNTILGPKYSTSAVQLQGAALRRSYKKATILLFEYKWGGFFKGVPNMWKHGVARTIPTPNTDHPCFYKEICPCQLYTPYSPKTVTLKG